MSDRLLYLGLVPELLLCVKFEVCELDRALVCFFFGFYTHTHTHRWQTSLHLCQRSVCVRLFHYFPLISSLIQSLNDRETGEDVRKELRKQGREKRLMWRNTARTDRERKENLRLMEERQDG